MTRVKHRKLCSARIVAHEDYLGGSPRLDGTRLSVRWFAANKDSPPTMWQYYKDYISAEHLAFMFLVISEVEAGLKEARED